MTIGMKNWHFAPHGEACSCRWKYLVQDIEGRDGDELPWDLNPDYQRGSVWDKNRQERFIGHVLAGGVVPPVYVQRFSGAVEIPNEVIDGQQRLRAVQAFMAGDIGAQVYHDGEWAHYTYAQMDTIERRSGVLSTKVVFVNLGREDRLRFYLRLNGGGVAHTDEELDRVRRLLVAERNSQ